MTRQLMALSAIFLCLTVLVGFVLDSSTPPVNAASPAETTTSTLTATATEFASDTPTAINTATETSTATATPDPCGLKPPAPRLGAPENGAVFPYTQNEVRLRWNRAACATGYRVTVQLDSKTGDVIRSKRGLTVKSVLIKNLPAGHTFFWRVLACNAAGCTRSKIHSFVIEPPPTPTPTRTFTPQPTVVSGTSTPAAGLPSSMANYQGPSVYLNSENPVYYFDCTWKWRQFGDIILVISDGFEPRERVNAFAYEISSGKYSMTGNYIADLNGWVRTAINTHEWPGGHFHLFFNGKASHIRRCGHFDLDHGPALAPDLQGPHPR